MVQSQASDLRHPLALCTPSHRPTHSLSARGFSSSATVSNSTHRCLFCPNPWLPTQYNSRHRHILLCDCLHGRYHKECSQVQHIPSVLLVRVSRDQHLDLPQHLSTWPQGRGYSQYLSVLSQKHPLPPPLHSNRLVSVRCNHHFLHQAYTPHAYRYSTAS